jgi:serine/threonine-protein kinase
MVAVKVCHPHLRDDAAFVARFLDEARIAAKIRHPNVVATLDCGEEGDDLFLVMEWIEGDRLAGLLEKGALAPAVAARIVCDALAGLQAAHELGNVHRDVSPQNILVGVDGVSRIADFGLAKALGASTISHDGVSRDGELRGKVAYMAPEQILGGTIGPAIDVWAAGVVLWESLTGRRLFARETEAETINAVLRFDAGPPSGLAELDAVVARALARDPKARWSSAHEMQLALEGAIALPPARAIGEIVRTGGVASAPRPETPQVDLPPPSRPRRRRTAAILLGALLAVIAVALFVRTRPVEETPLPEAAPSPRSAESADEKQPASAAPTQLPAITETIQPNLHPRPHVAKKPIPPAKPAPSGPTGYWPKEP